ncbi:MAG: hypothetical protein N3B10_07020 [Armatimonadetes bacterium]|nr:hypothetical protein [Armatimonadota bacterium]MCX7968224.1 hypothetical protein [Armatimonadota bacterium]MDW8142107.1 hypothetical protein [Armatimonadota bacterium]
MSRLLGVGLLILGLIGCAKFPEQPVAPISRDRLVITLVYDAPIDPNFFYYIAIDDDGDPTTGPLPALTRPWGNGWGVPLDENLGSRIRFFVEIFRQSAQVFRIQVFEPPFTAQPLGPALDLAFPQPNQIRVTVDLRQFFPSPDPLPERLELNFISVNELKTNPYDNTPRTGFDALGATGNEFISIPLTSTQTFQNGQGWVREVSGDCPIDALDLADWEVRVVRGE